MEQKMISKDAIVVNVKNFIIDNFLFGDTSQAPNNDDSFMNLGIVDSTGILEVINFLEEKYSIEVDDSELLPENLDSLDNIASFVVKKK